jgi:hypothetical protein
MRVARLVALVLAFAVAAAIAPLYAQTDTGKIDGRVFDEQKAGMPGVTITAKHVATGHVRTATSGSTGSYHFEAMEVGIWDITAEIQGFSTQVHKGITVQVNSPVTVDFTMKVGNLSETVVVTGEAPLVQTTKSDVGQVITNTMVENMPLNGRKFQDLELLVPGTRPANYYDPTKTEVGGISYGGLSGRSVNISVDGGDNNDGVVRGLLQQFSADAIQEYKVTTERYSAEFGRSTGGLVNVITKSGTNDLHGSGFLFARNEALNSETYFEKQTDAGKPPFSQQEPGATIGGPIIKDKAFFFLSYEYNRRNDYATVYTDGALPAEEGAFPKPFRDHMLTAKTDVQLATNNHLLLRYALEDQKTDHDFIGGKTLASAGATNTNLIHSFIAKDSAVFGNSKLNEFIVEYQYFDNNINAEDNTSPGITTPDFISGANINTPQQTIQKRLQIKDDFSFRKEGWGGDHDFKIGGELLHSHFGGFFTPTLYGMFYFNSPLPGNSIDAYMNGIADTFSGSAGTTVFNDNWTYVAGYFQDDWKPKGNVTVNMGLRWEMQAGPYQNENETPVISLLSQLGYPSQRKQDLKDFGPRVGIAWDVNGDGKSVVRGGWGIYYDEIFQNITLYEHWNDIRSPVNFLTFSPAPWTPSYYEANRTSIRNSFVDPTFAGQIMRLTSPDLKQPYSNQFNVGYSHSLSKNTSIDFDYIHALGEREIARWTIDTPYNLNTELSPAGVFAPQWARINVEGNRGHSRIDALYVTGKTRLKQAEIITTYALTKGMNIANDFNSYPGNLNNLNWDDNWGPMANDVRHRFTLAGVFPLPMGFQLSSSVQANTGKPYNPVIGYGGQKTAETAIDPTTGEPFGRNSFRGPGFATWDARISKDFKIVKGQALEVLFEVFNLTDHVNFSGDTAYGFNNIYGTGTTPLPTFGTPTQIVPGSNRQAEFGIRYKF